MPTWKEFMGVMDVVMTNPMVNYSEITKQTASEMYNVRDEYKADTYEQNVAISISEQRPFSVGAINVTGELNIGMMIRSACLLGAENFYIFGRKKFDKRSTVGAEKYINIVQYVFDDPIHADTEEVTGSNPVLTTKKGDKGFDSATSNSRNVKWVAL